MNIIKANLKYTNTLTPLPPENVKYIILHHAEAAKASPEDIHEWHLQNGWAGAGYNWYVRKDGSVYEMRGDNVGAQCYDYNSVSVGVCVEGNYESDTTMPDVQFRALVELLQFLKAKYPNLKEIGPHNKYYNTACPGEYFPLQNILNSKMEDENMDWKTIIEKAASSPDKWEDAINTAVNAAKADGDLGALEELQYLPILIEKVYKLGKGEL